MLADVRHTPTPPVATDRQPPATREDLGLDTRRPLALGVPALLLGLGAIVLLLAFLERGQLPPLRASVAALWASFAVGIWRLRLSRSSLLARLALALYAIPLLPSVGYLIIGRYYWWSTALAMDYQDDNRTLEIMMALGLVGMAGLLTGLLAASIGRVEAPSPDSPTGLGLPGYLAALAVALGLSRLGTPLETVLVARYAVEQSAPPGHVLHFDAANLAAYTLLCLLLIDAQLGTGEPPARRLKLGGWLASVGYIVVAHQLLRGHRECAGLIAAAIAFFLTAIPGHGAEVSRRLRRRMLAAVVVAAAAIAVFAGLQVTRSARGNRKLLAPATIFEGASHGTWTAVLLTDLALADDFRRGVLQFQHGATYWDYMRSLPPGFLADALGQERPLEATRGPAHLFTDVSAGGCHLPVVPFLNFGWWGPFLVLALYGWLLGRVDRWGDSGSRARVFAYTATFTFLPLWFWYGDMYVIRGAMLIALWWAAYRGALLLTSRHPLPSRRPADA